MVEVSLGVSTEEEILVGLSIPEVRPSLVVVDFCPASWGVVNVKADFCFSKADVVVVVAGFVGMGAFPKPPNDCAILSDVSDVDGLEGSDDSVWKPLGLEPKDPCSEVFPNVSSVAFFG